MGDHCAPDPAAATGWLASRDPHAGGYECRVLRAAYGMPVAAVAEGFSTAPTVYNYFWEWTRYGVLDRIHHVLLVKVREMEGREASPTAAIIDSQSVKTVDQKGDRRGTMRARRSTGASATS